MKDINFSTVFLAFPLFDFETLKPMGYMPDVSSRFLINFYITDQPCNILNFWKSLKLRIENAKGRKKRRRKETVVLCKTKRGYYK